ncbi:MAG: choice-of-anchor O protein [Xanthomonadales bacterium]|nr:choice-of-anchor O protein [Xanthomonadales bacterium]
MVAPDEAQGNLEAGLNASGIFRKNISKTEDWGETKQKLEVMPVYFPGLRSNGDPSLCVDIDGDKIFDEEEGDLVGVPYEEWRLNGDPLAEECDPRLFEDPEACQVTLIECRELAKPLLVTYMAKVDIYDEQVKEEFWPDRFSWDLFTAVSRDDGTTWKRKNISRMADLSSFELKTTGEPFPGTVGSPYLKVNDNKILTVWESKFCKSGNPRYSINLCDDPATEEVEVDDPLTEENECAIYCSGNPDNDTEVCEPDYPGDDPYYLTDIWGVRGSQGSVDYDEVDDVAELGIGEIPYSCLWAARGVIASQKELDAGTFDSLTVEVDGVDVDQNLCTDEDVPYDCCTGLETGTCEVALGDVVWFKPERLTSGRRDVYIPMLGSARGAGFAIAWQEDPSGLRPGKGKGPGEGWSGAITNHKSDMWYSYISYDDFNIVDENFVPGGPGGGTDADPDGEQGSSEDNPGLGRPKALVPFSLPVRITDNDMVNTHTLKVEASTDCPTFPDSTGLNDPICFPEVVDGSFVPIDAEEIAAEFCGHPDADPATCCDPDNHEGDPNCEDLKGLFGNSNGTKRYAYLARSIDEVDNATGLYLAGGDGVPDYQYYVDGGGTLDLCDVTGANSFFDMMPGSSDHERWFGFTNTNGVDKLVCVSDDGRLLDGDVYASRPMLQLQPYTKTDGTKSAWALFAYEESKGLGHSLAAEAHLDTDNPVDEIVGEGSDDSGQEKPIKQDIGKNMMYHSFDFAQPDLVSPGHIVNLPALCGGLYPTFCDDKKTPDIIETNEENPTCTCEAGQPVPLYFDYLVDTDGDPETAGEWIPDDTKFLQYRYEIARRARFLMQSPGKMGDSKTLGALIYKQGQEGQGRPADAYIRRFVKSGTGNPYKFENMVCTTYLDETFALPACPNGAGDKPSAVGYNCNVWGEASGDRLCGGIFDDPNGGYPRRDHINMTSADVDLAVGVGPEDDTPDDPTDDVYNRNKVLLWSQHEYNLGDESYGLVHEDGTACDVLNGEVCPGMYSNVRSHRGFIRGDFFAVAYALSPNWAAGRNGNDRYNFYVRKSFDGGQTWTTNPAGDGVYVCPEFRTDPYSPDPDGSGNLPPEAFDETCGTYDPETVPDGELPPAPVGIAMTNYLDPMGATADGVPAQFIAAGAFEPARNVSEIKSNKESSGDPRMGTTPPTYPLDGTSPTLAKLCPDGECVYTEDTYINNMFFVAWGTVDNEKSTGSSGVKAESGPLDIYYTRTEDYGDNYVKVPWVVGGVNSNAGYGETEWRFDYVAKGDPEEQGECQLRATSDGSKAYVIWHSTISDPEDPNVEYTRYYPWKPSGSTENDLWFRRLIFWPDEAVTPVDPITSTP